MIWFIVNNFKMSKTLFKVLANSYINNRHHKALLTDCFNAVSNPISELARKVKGELQMARQAFSYENRAEMMSVIQEENQRSFDEDMPSNRFSDGVRNQFNGKIGLIRSMEEMLDLVLSIYKIQIKKLAKELSEQNTKPKSLQKKDKPKAPKPKKQIPKNESQQFDIRKPPEPLTENSCLNCQFLHQKLRNYEQIEKQHQLEKNRWHTLSMKIDKCKQTIQIYEVEIKQKDRTIDELEVKIKTLEKKGKKDPQDEEQKKIKKQNTNLRGEKVLLSNQISTLKKQLVEKADISDVQQMQIKKLLMQIQNLESTLKWHLSTIDSLKRTYSDAMSVDSRKETIKSDHVEKINRILGKSLDDCKQNYQELNLKTKQLQHKFDKEHQKYDKTLSQLREILDAKNEIIIKLKSEAKTTDKTTYHTDMIKILTKKLAQRDEQIKLLSSDLKD